MQSFSVPGECMTFYSEVHKNKRSEIAHDQEAEDKAPEYGRHVEMRLPHFLHRSLDVDRSPDARQ